MKIISVSGPDGSGKTTQIRLLHQRLSHQGYKVNYFHVVQFSLLNRINNIISNQPSGPQSERTSTSKTTSSALGIWLRKAFLYIDLLRFQIYIHNLKQQKTDYLLTDRYFYDVLVNIAFLEHSSSFINAPIARPALAFFIDVSPKVIMSRESAPEQGTQYTIKKYQIYKKLVPKFDLISINGNHSRDEIAHNIAQRLASLEDAA